MGRGVTPASFKKTFCARVRMLVEQSGYSNKQLAQALGVEEDTMRRYQTRLLMPHSIIGRFCDFMGVKAEFLFRSDQPELRVVGRRE